MAHDRPEDVARAAVERLEVSRSGRILMSFRPCPARGEALVAESVRQ